MKTAPIRWICGTCFKIQRSPLTIYWSGGHGAPGFTGDVNIILPLCCEREMLLAGEPKLDVHGLRKKGTWVDPVDNIIPFSLRLIAANLDKSIMEII